MIQHAGREPEVWRRVLYDAAARGVPAENELEEHTVPVGSTLRFLYERGTRAGQYCTVTVTEWVRELGKPIMIRTEEPGVGTRLYQVQEMREVDLVSRVRLPGLPSEHTRLPDSFASLEWCMVPSMLFLVW